MTWEEWVATNPLRRWRYERKSSLMKTASQLGTSVWAVRCWETGANHPTRAHMQRLLGLAGITFEGWQEWLRTKPQ